MGTPIQAQRLRPSVRGDEASNHLAVVFHHDERMRPDERRVRRSHDPAAYEAVRLRWRHSHALSLSVEGHREQVLPAQVRVERGHRVRDRELPRPLTVTEQSHDIARLDGWRDAAHHVQHVGILR